MPGKAEKVSEKIIDKKCPNKAYKKCPKKAYKKGIKTCPKKG